MHVRTKRRPRFRDDAAEDGLPAGAWQAHTWTPVITRIVCVQGESLQGSDNPTYRTNARYAAEDEGSVLEASWAYCCYG